MQLMEQELTREAEMPVARGVAKVLVAVPYLIAVGWVALLFYCNSRGEPFNVSAEDGYLEWATCVFFFTTAVMALLATTVSRVPMVRRQRVFLVVFAVVCLLAIGEELSWGQRIFGFDPPTTAEDSILKVGHRDTAVHNLTIRTQYFQFSVGGMLFGGVLLAGLIWHGVWIPLAVRREAAKPVEQRKRGMVEWLGIFVPPLDLGILVSALVTLVVRRRLYANTEANEYKELIVPLIYSFMLARVFFAGRDRRDVAISAGLAVVSVTWLVGSFWYYARGM